MSNRTRWLVASLLIAGVTIGLLAWRWRPKTAEQLLLEARAALARGDQQEFNRLVRGLKDAKQENALALLRGEVRLAVAKQNPDASSAAAEYRLALRDLGQIRAPGPMSDQATLLGAECLVHLNERQLAAGVLEVLVKRQPDLLDAHRWLAAIYLDLNQQDALAHLEEWGRLDPTNGRPFRWIGLLKREANRHTEACGAYEEASRRQLDDQLRFDGCLEWSELLIDKQGDYAKALQVLELCPASFAGRLELRTLRAESLWGAGRQEEASQLVTELMKETPPATRALLLRARMYLSAERPKDAIPLLQQVLQREPHEHRGRQHLMEAYQQLGDPKQAAEQKQLLDATFQAKNELTKLYSRVQERPWDASLRWQMAELCTQLGLKGEAQTWARAVLALEPTHQGAKQLLQSQSGN